MSDDGYWTISGAPKGTDFTWVTAEDVEDTESNHKNIVKDDHGREIEQADIFNGGD